MTINPMNTPDVRTQTIQEIILNQQQQFQAEKQKYLNGLIPDYPEYPTSDQLYAELDRRLPSTNNSKD